MRSPLLLVLLLLTTSQLTLAGNNFPRFRGEDNEGIAANEKDLLKTWPAEGPRELWRVKLGQGFGSGVIYDDKVYVLDWGKNQDIVRAFDITNGQELWHYSYDGHSAFGSRATPTVNENFVVSIGPGGVVTGLERKTGKLAWSIDLVKDYGLEISKTLKNRLGAYGVAQSPLIDGDSVTIACGTKKALLINVDLKTGKVLWTTDNPKEWTMSHTSIMPFVLAGQKQYVYSSFDGIVAVSSNDGKILWEYPEWKALVWIDKTDPPGYLSMIPSPVVVAPDKLFFCAQNYKLGSMMLQLTQTDGRIVPREVFHVRDMPSIIQTPIYFNGRIFGCGSDDGFMCMSTEGKILWRQKGLGPWPFLIADSMIYILDKAGRLHLLDATAEQFKELAVAQIPCEKDGESYGAASWSPMAISNGRLVLRLGKDLVCLQVK